jgi:hypothetical protein
MYAKYSDTNFCEIIKGRFSMKPLGALLIVVLIGGTFGCNSHVGISPNVDWDYDVTRDFSRIKTYDWHAASGGIEINNLVLVRIKDAANTQLQAKGLEWSTNDPDILIIVYGGSRQQYTTRWRGWDDNLWYDEGRLKIQFFDPHAGAMIWWCETRADVYFQMPPEEMTQLVAKAVTRIIDKFPPTVTE